MCFSITYYSGNNTVALHMTVSSYNNSQNAEIVIFKVAMLFKLPLPPEIMQVEWWVNMEHLIE